MRLFDLCDFNLGRVDCIIIYHDYIYITLLQLRSKRFTVYYYPSHWILYQFYTRSELWQFYSCAHANSTTITFPFYRVPIYTSGSKAAMWIKVSYWRTKVPGDGGNWIQALWVRVKRQWKSLTKCLMKCPPGPVSESQAFKPIHCTSMMNELVEGRLRVWGGGGGGAIG